MVGRGGGELKAAPAKRTSARRRSGSPSGATLLQGDCLELLGTLEPESVDAIVTDPPYGIGFQNERWDLVALREAAERTGHGRLSPNEAFGVWCELWASECRRVLKPGAFLAAFGSPRTYHRLTCGIEDGGLKVRDTLMWLYGTGMSKSHRYPGGRATTLKPAFEPIVLARRPFEGTTEATIARHGTGALNTDACAVNGRHPANVVVGHEPRCTEALCASGCAVAFLDADADLHRPRSASGVSPSRIFYCPKVSRREREAGCEHLPGKDLDLFPRADSAAKRREPSRNSHPTVKPLELMRWLVRLCAPAGGIVLDPTCGTGSTGAATLLEGRRFLGIELDPTYLDIAAARIAHWAPPGTPSTRSGRPAGRRRG